MAAKQHLQQYNYYYRVHGFNNNNINNNNIPLSLSVTCKTTMRILSIQVRLFVRLHVHAQYYLEGVKSTAATLNQSLYNGSHAYIMIQDAILIHTYNACRSFYLFSIFFFSLPLVISRHCYITVQLMYIMSYIQQTRSSGHI